MNAWAIFIACHWRLPNIGVFLQHNPPLTAEKLHTLNADELFDLLVDGVEGRGDAAPWR